MEGFVKVDVFGMARINRDKIYAAASGVKLGGKAVSHSVTVDLDEPIQEIGEEEVAVILFGSVLEENGKWLTFTRLLGGPETAVNHKAVHSAIGKLLKKFIS